MVFLDNRAKAAFARRIIGLLGKVLPGWYSLSYMVCLLILIMLMVFGLSLICPFSTSSQEQHSQGFLHNLPRQSCFWKTWSCPAMAFYVGLRTTSTQPEKGNDKDLPGHHTLRLSTDYVKHPLAGLEQNLFGGILPLALR
jgi:hypothetical protein